MFSKHEYWSGLSGPPPWDLPNPGIEPASLTSSALVGAFFTTRATWEALNSSGEGHRVLRQESTVASFAWQSNKSHPFLLHPKLSLTFNSAPGYTEVEFGINLSWAFWQFTTLSFLKTSFVLLQFSNSLMALALYGSDLSSVITDGFTLGLP